MIEGTHEKIRDHMLCAGEIKEFTSNEYGFTYTSRQTELNGITLTISKATVPGLTLDMHRQFRSNLGTIMPKMDDKLKIVECPAVDGLRAII